MCVLSLLAMTLTAQTAVAATFSELYGQALAARDRGDLDAAAAALERALEIDPDNADALLQLGIVYSWMKRYEDAIGALSRARAIAPDYAEVAIQIARIRIWQGRLSEGLRALEPVLATHPGRADALLLQATANRRLGELAAAEQAYERIVADDPDSLDALVGLGDIAAERHDPARAGRMYRRAAQAHPESEVPRARLAALAPKHRWRTDASMTYSKFARKGRDPWRQVSLALGYRYSADTAVSVSGERENRGFAVDRHFAVGLDHRFADDLGGYLSAGVTPDADFREKWAIDLGGRVRVRGQAAPLGPTWFRLDGRHAAYDTGDVETLKPTLVQYLAGGDGWLTLQQINVWDETGKYLQGWLARADMQITDAVHAFVGVGVAPETEEGETIDTFSQFVGLDYAISERLGAHLSYAREDREKSYIRHAVTAAITVRF